MKTSATSKETLHRSESPEQTMAIGKSLADLHPDGACFYLDGDLGAGKTLLAKGIASGYGVEPDRVVSPTFALVNRYSGGSHVVYHIDLYRIENERELDELGLEELEDEVEGRCAAMVIEWPRKLDELGHGVRSAAVWIHLEVLDERTREIRISEPDATGA